MNLANNEEAGPSGIAVKKEIETDEGAGIKNVDFILIMPIIVYYVLFNYFFFCYQNFLFTLELLSQKKHRWIMEIMKNRVTLELQ